VAYYSAQARAVGRGFLEGYRLSRDGGWDPLLRDALTHQRVAVILPFQGALRRPLQRPGGRRGGRWGPLNARRPAASTILRRTPPVRPAQTERR